VNRLPLAGGVSMVIFEFDSPRALAPELSAVDMRVASPDYFKARFRRYKDGVPEDAKGKFTLMPWHNLAQLPDDDLEAIYTYLMMQPAIEHKVERFPTETKLARN